MNTLIHLTTTAILSLVAINAAQAGAPTESISRTVQYADLNLDSTAGAAALFARIKGAAQGICDKSNSHSARDKAVYKACLAAAVNDAVAEINHPVLTQYASERSTARPAAPIKVATSR